MTPPPAEQLAARIFVGPALRVQPDGRLVDLVRDGYDAAFEEIVRRYRKQLDRFAAAIVGGRSEDVTQDSFSKALLALRGSEAEIELRPWLYRIVRNTALNDLRDRAPAAEQLSERLPGARSAAAEVEAREELRDLMDRLQALPEPQRAALVMRELEGLSHEEIAAALGVSGGAARQTIYRARAALREGFGFLLPLPALRMLTEHGAEMVKAGAATVLIAGTVGAGVAIDHHRGGKPGPEAVVAAPLVAGTKPGPAVASTSGGGTTGSASDRNSAAGDQNGGRHPDGGSLGSGAPSASGAGPSGGSQVEGPGSPGSGPGHSGSGSDGPGPSSGSQQGSGSGGDRHGSGSGREDGESSGDSSGGSGEDGGSSGGSGGEDNSGSGGDSGESSGSGSSGGEVESEAPSEPIQGESTETGGESASGDSAESSSGGDGHGSGATSGSSTGGSDESP